jgi:hypothetical protein
VFTFHENQQVARPNQGRSRLTLLTSRKAFKPLFAQNARSIGRDWDTAVQYRVDTTRKHENARNGLRGAISLRDTATVNVARADEMYSQPAQLRVPKILLAR